MYHPRIRSFSYISMSQTKCACGSAGDPAGPGWSGDSALLTGSQVMLMGLPTPWLARSYSHNTIVPKQSTFKFPHSSENFLYSLFKKVVTQNPITDGTLHLSPFIRNNPHGGFVFVFFFHGADIFEEARLVVL